VTVTDAEFYDIPADDIPADDAPATTTQPERPPDRQAAGVGSRFKLFNGFVDFDLAKLRRNDLAVWVVLFRLTDATTNTARASYQTIAASAGCSAATVKRAVKQLRERGLLRVVRQGGMNKGPSTFRVTTGTT